MELKDFIKQTIKSIADASTELENENNFNYVDLDDTNGGVDFDIAVTIEDATNLEVESQAKGGIFIAPFATLIGTKESSEESLRNQNITRIKFKIRMDKTTKDNINIPQSSGNNLGGPW